MLASLAMGAMAQRATSSRSTTSGPMGGGGLMDVLGPMLSGSTSAGGSMLGDLLGKLGRTFGQS